MKNTYLLKNLLLNPDSCIPKQDLPDSINQWNEFLTLAHYNKLTSFLYHFLSCKKCSPKIPKEIKDKIIGLYTEFIIRQRNYRKIKTKLKKFIKDYSAPLILVKDFQSQKFLKYDIDILGRYKDLPKLRQFLEKIGYDPIGYHYGWPDKPIPQYKFSPLSKYKYYPQIEDRYQAITIYLTKKNILDKKSIEKFTKDLWQYNNIEYSLIYLILIYYFEDGCKGLNNLYRIWQFLNQEKEKLDWEKVGEIARKYKVTNIIAFILTLAGREFMTNTSDRLHLSSRSIQLALRLIDLDYICRARARFPKDGYIHFLTRGLLAEEPIWQKILFFAHPKRLFFLLWALSEHNLQL